MLTKENFIAVGSEKLADILMSIYQSNNEVRKEIDIIFAGFDENPQKLISMIKKEISALKRSTGFVNFNDSFDLADRLDNLRLLISRDLFLKSPKTAFELMLEFLNLHRDILGRSDNSGGCIAHAFQAACDDLEKLSEKSDLLPSEFVEIAFTIFMENNYCVYDKIIHNLKNALKEEGLSTLRSKFTLCLSSEPKESFRSGKINDGLKAVADCMSDVDAFIHSCSLQNGIADEDILKIVEQLIAKDRSLEAITWLDRVKFDHKAEDCSRLRIKALVSLGEHGKAQEERILLFKKKLSSDLYEDILKFASPDDKTTFRKETMQMLLSHSSPLCVVKFLMEIKEINQLKKFIRLRHAFLRGDLGFILRPAAEKLQDEDPVAATLIYRRMINAALYGKSFNAFSFSKPNSKYWFAAKDLVTCLRLSNKISDWEGCFNHDEYFEDVKKTHKCKKQLWSDYEKALREQEAPSETPNAKRKKF